MAYDKFFGFELTQRKTLENLLGELEARIAELEEEVANLPDPIP